MLARTAIRRAWRTGLPALVVLFAASVLLFSSHLRAIAVPGVRAQGPPGGGGAGPTCAPSTTDPAVIGQFSQEFDSGIEGIHLHLLPNAKVLVFGFDTERVAGDRPRIWDPAFDPVETNPNAFTVIPYSQDLFCAGHAFAADGRLVIHGGHVTNCIGTKETTVFDYRNLGTSVSPWFRGVQMAEKRWYPTTTTLPNGEMLVVSGSFSIGGDCNPAFDLPQVYNVDTNAYRDLTTARRVQDLYPFMYVAPNGQVFNAGRRPDTFYLDTSGTGAWTFVANTNYPFEREEGTSVMYAPGKILIAGGGDPTTFTWPPTETAEVVDLNEPNPSWRSIAPMACGPRRHGNGTLLPDGRMFLVGGQFCEGGAYDIDTCPVLQTEIWDPATETWQVGPSLASYHGYHSNSLLLPDGRVLATGGDASFFNWQIYSPSYLFKGARPTITSTPTQVTYGQEFLVQTPDASAVARVTWIRLGSTTHAYDQNQRFNTLSFRRARGRVSGVNVTAPASQNLAPPGHYLLFILNSLGVPSVGTIVQII